MRSVFMLFLLAGLCCLVVQPAQAAKKDPSFAISDTKALKYFLNDGRKKHKACKAIKLSVALPNYCVEVGGDDYEPQAGDGGFVDATLTDIHTSKCGVGNEYIKLSGMVSSNSAFNMTFYNLPAAVRGVFTSPSSKLCMVTVTLRSAPDNNDATVDIPNSIEIECGSTTLFNGGNTLYVNGNENVGIDPAEVKLLQNAKVVCVQ